MEMKASTLKSGGTMGEPSKASIKGGKKYHDHLTSRLVDVIRMLQKK